MFPVQDRTNVNPSSSTPSAPTNTSSASSAVSLTPYEGPFQRPMSPLFSRFHTPSHHPSRACDLTEIEDTTEPTRWRPSQDSVLPIKNELQDRRRSSLIQSLAGEIPSVPQDKWHHHATSCISTRLSMLRHSTLRRIWFWLKAVIIFICCFILLFIFPKEYQNVAPVVLGSLVSLLSSIMILISFLFQSQNRRYPNELLVYVALCESVHSMLILINVISYCSKTSTTCTPPNFNSCVITSVLEMCLLVASIGWFGCAILHLFVNVSNPFANYKSQMKRYHIGVWGSSIMISLLIPFLVFSDNSQVTYEMNRIEMCRMISLHFPQLPRVTTVNERTQRITQWQILNLQYWGVFYGLVVLLVVAAQFILAVGWWRSNSATVIALRARRTMMKRMTTYVHTLNATWLIILVLFFWYRSNPTTLDHIADISALVNAEMMPTIAMETLDILNSDVTGVFLLDALFHFVLSAKGYFTCVVWIAVNRQCWPRPSYQENDDEEEQEEATVQGDSHNFSCPETAQLTWTSVRSSDASMSGTSGSTPELVRPSLERLSGSAPYLSSMHKSPARTPRESIYQNNETLQREIIYYTVCGITQSILKSAQDPSTNVYFQELMVGVPDPERVSPDPTNDSSNIMGSPRAYCQTRRPPQTIPSVSTNTNTKSMTSRDQNASFASFLSLDGDNRDSSMSAHSNSLMQSFQSTISSSSQHGQPPRGSIYPISHVPFEIFEQQLDLQSQRSSVGALSLSPLFSSFRRTANALYHHHHTPRSTSMTSPPRSANPSIHRPPNTISMTSPPCSPNPPNPSIHRRPNVDHPRPKLFIDYAPAEFRMLRQAFGLSDEAYLSSFRTTAKERVSSGSSGAFMFFSGDNALIVKSMKEKECRKLIQMIPTYLNYILSHPASRIIRFFGCHRIRLYGRNFYFVVMSNVLSAAAHTVTMNEKYDVKGSWIDRQAKVPQIGDSVVCAECYRTYTYGQNLSHSFPFHTHRPDTILKDLDLQRPLYLSKPIARTLYTQIVLDAEFLHKMGIMDYSLLIGVHKCSHPDQVSRPFVGNASLGGRPLPSNEDGWKGVGTNLAPIPEDGEDPEEMYFIGIIDILQEWNWEKQLENVGKTLLGKSSSGISAVAPDAYCERFKAKIAQVLMLDPMDHENVTEEALRKTFLQTNDSRANTPQKNNTYLQTTNDLNPKVSQDRHTLVQVTNDSHTKSSQDPQLVLEDDDDDPALVFTGVIDTSSQEAVHIDFDKEVHLEVA